MALSINRWTRKLHRWGAIAISIPLLLVISSGLLLQVKKQLTWVQPPTVKGSSPGQLPAIDWEEIVKIANQEEYADAQIQSWEDIDRLDIRPDKGIVKVRSKTRWELQLDLANGDVLHYQYRRSDLIESLHDGSFFGAYSKLIVFLGNGLFLLGLWTTGLYLWYLPFAAKRKKKNKQSRQTNTQSSSASAR